MRSCVCGAARRGAAREDLVPGCHHVYHLRVATRRKSKRPIDMWPWTTDEHPSRRQVGAALLAAPVSMRRPPP